MDKRIFFSLALTVMLSSCEAQEVKEGKSNNNEHEITPQTNIIVNKEYDEEGKLIRYDSTYSSYYSSIEGDSLMADSMMNHFRQSLFERFPISKSPFFESFFFEDSLSGYDFYKSDFFKERYRLNQERMKKLFNEMDTIKNQFFEKEFEEQ